MNTNSRTPVSILMLMLLCLMAGPSLWAQKLTKDQITTLAHNKLPTATLGLKAFLQLPNDGHFPEQAKNNALWCDSIFKTLGFQTKVLETEGIPLLFAERKFHKKAKTILFYLQIDGQPVDSAQWDQANPYSAVLKEKVNGTWQPIGFERLQNEYNPDWRIFGRSVSDSKGPAMAFISALEILKEHKIKPQFNVKVIMDFQEEMGSPFLAKAVTNNKALLEADMLFIMDGTRHVSNLPTLTFGARGIATAQLRIFGAKQDLHSGQYGNFAPNPVFKTAQLLGSLKDENGKVLIPGFYDGIVLSEAKKSLINSVPENRDSLIQRLGISTTDAIGNTYQEALQYPTLNIRGMKAGWVEKEVRTIIPSEVIVEIDMRLVPESDGKRLMELLKAYIQDQGYHLVGAAPTEEERSTYPKLASFDYTLGSLPFQTPMDSDIGQLLNKAIKKVFGDQVVNMQTTGGSQPIAPFINTLDIPAVSLRIPNPDNNIHAPNENLRIGNFLEGIITCLAVMDERP
ncbi:MAG: M20/M25/M40 family metallo-hydrolase [Maribacter sp.]|uniref:M20/M25/M40 family metallo-hydrolase n=1 Tax=Maribacter sp. TaxID=1897614 RepID=UPI003C71E233